jgi:hypothetical protein
LGYILGDIFANSSGHTGAESAGSRRREKKLFFFFFFSTFIQFFCPLSLAKFANANGTARLP